MHDTSWRLLLSIAVLSLLLTGCSSFNSHMADTPPRSGAPPYDDPEANGNPAKAWYN